MIRVLFSSENCGDLSEWEETFLESIKGQQFLSEKQHATLHKVFDSVTCGERHPREYELFYDDEADYYGDTY